MNLNTETELRPQRDTHNKLPQKATTTTRRETSLTQTEDPDCSSSSTHQLLAIMVKEDEIIMADAGGGGRGGYMDLLGLGEDDYLLCMSPSSYFASSVVSSTTTSAVTTASPTCASYLDLAPAYHHMLSFAGQEQQYHGDGVLGFQYHGGGDHGIPPPAVPQKSSPTTECSSSISSMSSSPPATAVSAVSCSKPQAFKKKGSRSSEQRKAASAAAAAAPGAAGATTNKRPRVRREGLGERIIALQQLVSPFGKSDTASVLHEALGYIRFLHDQLQVLSSPYMQRQPASSAAHVPESAAGTVVEPPRPGDLRSRGLCLVPVCYTEHLAGNSHGGNGADLWSVAAGMEMAKAAAADNKGPAGGMLRGGGGGGGGGGGYPRRGHLA